MNAVKRAAMFLALVSAASMANAALVSHWALDDGPPATVASDSADSNPAAFAAGANSPTWSSTPAVGSYALAVNGSQWASAPDSANLDLSSGITFSTWVKRNQLVNREIVVGKGDGTSSANTAYWIEIQGNKQVAFYIGSSTGDHYLPVSAMIGDTTAWHHVLGTWNGSLQEVYVDGVRQTTTASWTGTITNSAAPMMIGRSNYGGLWFSGLIDDVGLWDAGLSEGKAKAVYGLGKSTSAFPQGLDPLLGYNLGVANQLFALYDAGSGGGSLIYGGVKWQYATGLTTDLGSPKYDTNSNYLLRLDASGTGLIGIVPEPSALALAVSGGLCLLCLAGRRWKRRIEGT